MPITVKGIDLARHGPNAAHLEPEPGEHPLPLGATKKQKTAGLFRKIDHDRAGFENRQSIAIKVCDGGNGFIRTDLEKPGFLLNHPGEVDCTRLIGTSRLFKDDRRRPTIRCRRRIAIDHRLVPGPFWP